MAGTQKITTYLRLLTVLKVLDLIFREGYATRGADAPPRLDLANEAIRVTRLLWRLLPY